MRQAPVAYKDAVTGQPADLILLTIWSFAPMTTFDDRKDKFENKFAHDAELRFKAEARRNKLLGLWVAEKLGLAGDEAAAYAKEVVVADLAEAGEEDVIRKILADVQARNVDLSEHRIRAKMAELAPIADQQIRSE